MIRNACLLTLVLVACSGTAEAPRSPSGEAASPPVAADSPPIDTKHCSKLVEAWHRSCGTEVKAGMEQCTRLARLSEAAGCVQQAKRSYECGSRSFEGCTNAECCKKTISSCDDIDLALDHCMRGYCTNHGGNPDCAATFPPDAPPAPSPSAPSTPPAAGSPASGMALLTIRFLPTAACAGGQFFVDGIASGSYPIHRYPVPAGRHRIHITSAGDCGGYGDVELELASGIETALEPARFR